MFPGYQKVPRSPTPLIGKTPKSDSEMRRKPLGTYRDEGEVLVRVLSDADSLFVACQGLTLHYKLSLSGSSPRSLSSAIAFLEPIKLGIGRINLEKPVLSVLSKTQSHLHRSFSNQFHISSLYAPLLGGSEELPVLNLDAPADNNETDKLNSVNLQPDDKDLGHFGVVLVHGFGGGVFSWRHVMGVLARQIGCTVAAFDRPGWGLTSRLRRKDWEGKELSNPYTLETQVILDFA